MKEKKLKTQRKKLKVIVQKILTVIVLFNIIVQLELFGFEKIKFISWAIEIGIFDVYTLIMAAILLAISMSNTRSNRIKINKSKLD